MVLGHIERGTHLYIFKQPDQTDIRDIWDAEFRYLEDDTLFSVRCAQLYEDFEKLDRDSGLLVSFMTGPNINTFTGQVKEKQRAGMVLIEQISDIETHKRRKFDRDEIRVGVRLYGLHESELPAHASRLPENEPVFIDTTFDISLGGLCIITNTQLDPESGPYYLAEFSLSEWDYHLLPVKLVRHSDHPRTRIGRYDYGFQFCLDTLPDKAAGLAKGILSKKVSSLK